ncbi:MAG: hypothetical protein NW226_11370 [Microscillaceae bacterium]|nr:hypothetical protein [Microscillaceae bacterium]
MDKELAKLYPVSESKKRFADKLVKVYLKSGEEQWLLVHVEVQGYSDKTFPERMFTYFYRIRDRYQKDILAMVILTDEKNRFHPKNYSYQYLDTSVLYKFKTFKILSKKESELDQVGNPFSIVMLTAYKALQKGLLKDNKQYEWKITLIRKLLAAGYPNEKIRHILNFLRYYVNLKSETLVQKLDNEINTLTQNRKSMGIEEAILNEVEKRGEEKKSFEAVRNMLLRNFSDKDIMEIQGVDQEFVDKVRASLSQK